MNEVISNMLTRRSVRKYLPTQISDEALQSILQAGLYAPCAGGRQGVLFLVCQNAEVNEVLGSINKAAFRGRISTNDVYISKEQPSIADDPTINSGFYGAPTVVTLCGLRNFLHAEHDCAVAAENMMLAAHSLNIGSCMLGRAAETFAAEPGLSLLQKWQVPQDYLPVCHVLLGHIDGSYPQAKPRKDGRIIFGD
jgi:nitroreductase